MTRIKRELLFRDLCARLPYGVKVYGLYSPEGSFYSKWHNGELIAIDRTNTKNPSFEVKFENPVPYRDYCGIEEIKPYLRPMSSMTEEEEKEYKHLTSCSDYTIFTTSDKVVAWLDRKMFDHRGLIPNGLALEAPEGMYKLKE